MALQQTIGAPRRADTVTWILIAILAVVVIYGVYDWSYSRTAATAPQAAKRAVTAPVIVRSMSSAPKPPATIPPTAAAAVVLTDDQIRQRFSQALRDVNTCLALDTPAPLDRVDPTLDNWLEAMKPALEAQVLQTDDASSIDLSTPDGEHRRIHVELDYSGADRIVRRVKYFKVAQDNSLDPIPLDVDAAVDPSETFLASLEQDGTVTSRERTQRIYFAGGEEVVVTEKDGRIADLNMNRNGKAFHCRPLDPGQAACECQ